MRFDLPALFAGLCLLFVGMMSVVFHVANDVTRWTQRARLLYPWGFALGAVAVVFLSLAVGSR